MHFPTLSILLATTSGADALLADINSKFPRNRHYALPTWSELEGETLRDSFPSSIDSVLQPETPSFSKETPTFFRERHGWCPYSERVWLALEHLNVDFSTIRIDNTGGGRPRYFSGQTPQMKWPDGSTQGESMDLVKKLDSDYGAGKLQTRDQNVQQAIASFRSTFPQRARPSSRAAFLFQGNGDPLWRSTFEETLAKTNDLLSDSDGPFFCGGTMSAADVSWAPFLERYRYQLPCLHEGLEPFCQTTYPHLHDWFQAMDKVPAYASRVKGDASSWRKVLTMAGFGNAGVPPEIVSNIQQLQTKEIETTDSIVDQSVWFEYIATRPYLAATPQLEAAATIVRNRHAIVKDALKRSQSAGLPTASDGIEDAMKGLVLALSDDDRADSNSLTPNVITMAKFLDDRMCVPRDMGAMSAAAIKHIAFQET